MKKTTATKADFQKIVEIVQQSTSGEQGWQDVLDYSSMRMETSLVAPLGTGIEEAVQQAVQDLHQIFALEPVPTSVECFLFGLFDLGTPDEERICVGYYVSGGEDFDPSDYDSLNVTYFPENRIIRSHFLDRILFLSQDSDEPGDFLQYATLLGAAGLLTRFSLRALSEQRPVLVGFDEGDIFQAG